MSTIAVIKAAKQENLFRLSDEERAAKYVQVLGCLDELEALKAEKKEFLSGIMPASALGPQMTAARDAERAL